MGELTHPIIESYGQEGHGCPEEYEGKLSMGKYFNFRYRHGTASFGWGDSLHAARRDQGRLTLQVGDHLQGTFENQQQRDDTFTALLRDRMRDQLKLRRLGTDEAQQARDVRDNERQHQLMVQIGAYWLGAYRARLADAQTHGFIGPQVTPEEYARTGADALTRSAYPEATREDLEVIADRHITDRSTGPTPDTEPARHSVNETIEAIRILRRVHGDANEMRLEHARAALADLFAAVDHLPAEETNQS